MQMIPFIAPLDCKHHEVFNCVVTVFGVTVSLLSICGLSVFVFIAIYVRASLNEATRGEMVFRIGDTCKQQRSVLGVLLRGRV